LQTSPNNEKGKRVLNAAGLSCAANWRRMRLANVKMLHVTDPPELVEDFQ